MVRLMARVTAMLALLAAALVGATQVFAHADYERSEPERNENVPASPEQVDVFFTQDVRKVEGAYYVRVFDDTDTQVSDADGVVDDDDRRHIFATLPADLPSGRYIVRWMTTSDEDGDDAEGAFCFYVAAEPTADQAAECAEFDEVEPTLTSPPSTPINQETPPTVDATEQPGTTPTPTTTSSNDDDGGVPTGAIVGGAIAGGVVLVLVLGAAVIWLRRALE